VKNIAIIVVLLITACQTPYKPVDETKPIDPGAVSASALNRGANMTFNSDTYPTLNEEAFDTWKSWGISILRFTFDKDDFSNALSDSPGADIWSPYADNLAALKTVLGWMKAHNMEAMISLDHIWGDDQNSQSMWTNNGNNAYLNHRIALCGAMATWIRDNNFSSVVTYLEVWNEPYPCDDAIYTNVFLPAAIAAIRAVDTVVTISVMPPHDWGLLWGFQGWNGASDSNVLYSTHIYAPQTYTHQGVLSGYPLLETGWPGTYKNYPSDAVAAYTDIEAGRELMDVIADFRTRTGKEVMVTEFGVARWAKQSGLWVRDMVSLMEEYNIGWLYHSIAGWNGWNPSFSATAPEGKDVFGNGSPTLDLLKTYWQLPY